MTRIHPATTASSGPSPLRVLWIAAGITLALGLAAQGWAWIDPAPAPVEGPVTGPVSAGAVTAAVARVALWAVLPLQVIALAVLAAFPSLSQRAARSRR